MAKQDSDNKYKNGGADDWMLDNPFMNKVPTKGGGYAEMRRPTTIVPKPEIRTNPGVKSEVEQDDTFDPYEITEDDYHKSLTPSALQAPGWRTPTDFPCCPKEVKPEGLKEYEDNLKPELVFSSNQYDKYYVIDRAVDPKRNLLFVLAKNENKDGYYGTYAIAAIEIKYNKYTHISMKRFGHITDATKFYKSLIGEYELTENEAILYWES